MSWILKGLAGPLKDKLYPLKSGMTLGRQGAVQVPDLKVSAIHARILRAADGGWVIEDNNSKNGVRIDGQRVTSAELSSGSIFYIGDQGFEVVDTAKKSAEEGPERPPIQIREDPNLPPPTPAKKAQRYWHELLAGFMEKNVDTFVDKALKPVAPLNPALVLDFVRGVQASTRWVVGYGPRKVGPNSMDLPIWEPGAPAECFEIVPTNDGIVFKTSHPELVQLNGQAVDNQVLRVGDTIKILDTVIEVDFTE
jgi:hypothetical protein